MKDLRVFFVGGVMSYRALFNWISPWIYIPTMLGGTLFVLLFFTYLGRYTDVEDESFFVVKGEVAFGIGAESTTASAGTLVHLPSGTVHWFRFGKGGAALPATAPAR